jgi:hypothetical protein
VYLVGHATLIYSHVHAWRQFGVIFVGGPPAPVETSLNLYNALQLMVLTWAREQAVPLGMALGALFLLREP